MDDTYFKYKYEKYKRKYILQKRFIQKGGIIIPKHNNFLLQTQIGGKIRKNLFSEKSVPSTYNKIIYIKKSNGPDDPAYMKFDDNDNNNLCQTMYDANDFEIIYLAYIYPVISFIQYVNPNKILIVGLGGGHIPMLIRKLFPTCKINIVELDGVVVDAAKEIGFMPDNNMNIHIGDGIQYCNTTSEKNYDCIIIDLDEKHPKLFNSLALKNLLNDDGILIINALDLMVDELHSDKIFLKTLPEYFPCIKIYKASHINYVYLCGGLRLCEKIKQPIDKNNLSTGMKKLKYLDQTITAINNMESQIIAN
jgi:spermidine synthase